MKKLLMVLFAATIMTLTLSGKSNTKAKNKKAAPSVIDACFTSNVNMDSYEASKEAYEINSLSLNTESDFIIFKIDNSGKNFNEIQFSPNSDFEPNIHYDNLYQIFKDKKIFWANIGLRWSEFPFKDDFAKSNGTIYIRAIDKNGIPGETFEISEVTIIK